LNTDDVSYTLLPWLPLFLCSVKYEQEETVKRHCFFVLWSMSKKKQLSVSRPKSWAGRIIFVVQMKFFLAVMIASVA